MNNITFRNIVAFILATIASTAIFLGLSRLNDYEQAHQFKYVQSVNSAEQNSGSKFDKQ